MAKTSGRSAATYFIADASPEAVEVQRALTEGPYHCNIMMVANGEQAMAILEQEARGRNVPAVPHVVLIYGGLTDGRAAALVDALRADRNGSATPLVAVVAPADHAEVAADALTLAPFAMAHLKPLLAEQGFWWVMAKLG